MTLSKINPDNVTVRKFSESAPCGAPRNIGNELETEIYFGKYWVPDSRDCYAITAVGDSMIGAHIFDGDMLVINCGIEPSNGRVVVAWLNGELTVKRLFSVGNRVELRAENVFYPTIMIGDEDDFRVLGVVTSAHREL
jgi:DNA polymerase V